MFVSNVCVEKTFLSTKMGKMALVMDKSKKNKIKTRTILMMSVMSVIRK